MPKNTLLMLAEISYALGFIGHDELDERIAVAFWLNNDNNSPDPRHANSEDRKEQESEKESSVEDSEITLLGKSGKPLEHPDWECHFVAFKKWYFTRSDPDSYPSTPHGHLDSASRPWPKLNPYTGRAFSAKHQEDQKLQLTKREMKQLWGTEAFRDFCRSHILWYVDAYPHYRFPVPHPMRFPRL
jgi:hypothetical protein